MENEYDLRIAAILAKAMAIMCFRNTVIEDFHDGIAPVSPYRGFLGCRGD